MAETPPAYRRIMDDLAGTVKRYYENINDGKHVAAYDTLEFYAACVDKPEFIRQCDRFRDLYLHIEVMCTYMEVTLGEANDVYGGRDYAIGETVWEDGHGVRRRFYECWVLATDARWKNRTFNLVHWE